MNYDEHKCPDRCDIEFTYDWDHTNLYLGFVKGELKYMLNAGDTISVRFDTDKISPEKVSVISDDNMLDLENKGSGLWEGTIPSSWTSKSVFSVVLQRGNCKALLYEGLLNYGQTDSFEKSAFSIPDNFIQVKSNGVKVARDSDLNFVISLDGLVKSTDKSVNVTEQNGTYDLSVKSLEDRVTANESEIDKRPVLDWTSGDNTQLDFKNGKETDNGK